MEQKKKCIKARLMATEADGAYVSYIFEDLKTGEYIWTTKCPNWRGKDPDVLQDGFLEFKNVEAGVDTYFHNASQQFIKYQYDAIYFHNFVPITHVLNNGVVVGKNSLKVS